MTSGTFFSLAGRRNFDFPPYLHKNVLTDVTDTSHTPVEGWEGWLKLDEKNGNSRRKRKRRLVWWENAILTTCLLLSVALETHVFFFSFQSWVNYNRERRRKKLNSIDITSSGTRRDNHFWKNISRHYLFKIGMRPRGENQNTFVLHFFQSPTLSKKKRKFLFFVVVISNISRTS
jgi:hypothetical protein